MLVRKMITSYDYACEGFKALGAECFLKPENTEEPEEPKICPADCAEHNKCI